MPESGQHMLLEEYNFGLDDSLDGEVLDRVIAHQKKNKQEKQQLGGRIKELLWVYTSRSTAGCGRRRRNNCPAVGCHMIIHGTVW